MPFEDDEVPLKNIKGTKLTNERSSVSSKHIEEKKKHEELKKQAFEQNRNDAEYKEQALKLAIKYKETLENTSLKQNKTSVQEQQEIEVINEIVTLANSLNNDEGQPEGIGSVGVITLILKCMFLQRDRINNLSYKLEKLEKFLEKNGQ